MQDITQRPNEKAIDTVLTEEQAGVSRGGGCMDQIFVLRNILKQSLEWNTSFSINFTDFKRPLIKYNEKVIEDPSGIWNTS